MTKDTLKQLLKIAFREGVQYSAIDSVTADEEEFAESRGISWECIHCKNYPLNGGYGICDCILTKDIDI